MRTLTAATVLALLVSTSAVSAVTIGSKANLQASASQQIVNITASWTDHHELGKSTFAIHGIPFPCESDGVYLSTDGLFTIQINDSQTLWQAGSDGKSQLSNTKPFKALTPLGYGFFGAGSKKPQLIGYRALPSPAGTPVGDDILQLAAVNITSGEDVWTTTIHEVPISTILVAPRLANDIIVLVIKNGTKTRIEGYSAADFFPGGRTKPVWSTPVVPTRDTTPYASYLFHALDVTSNTAYVYLSNVTGGFVVAFDVNNGSRKWAATSGSLVLYTPMMVAGRCYADAPQQPAGIGAFVANNDAQTMMGLNASTGEKVWEKEYLSEPTRVFRDKAGPATSGETGELYQFDGSTGKITWSSHLGDTYHTQTANIISSCGYALCTVMQYRKEGEKRAEGKTSSSISFPLAFMARYVTKKGIENIVVSEEIASESEESNFIALALLGWEGRALLLTGKNGGSSMTLLYFKWEENSF